MDKTKIPKRDERLDRDGFEVELSLLEADAKEEKEDKEVEVRGKCVDAPKDKTRCVVAVRMGVTEYTNNPRAHRRTVEYMQKVFTKSYQSQIVQITSSTGDQCVQACLFVKKTCAIPLANAIKDKTFLELMNDTYLMYLRHPNKEINPQNLDMAIRMSKKADSNTKFNCCAFAITPYVRAYDTVDLVHITCPADLIPFDADGQLRIVVFPHTNVHADVAADSGKSGKKKKKQRQGSANNDTTKEDIIAYLSNDADALLSDITDEF